MAKFTSCMAASSGTTIKVMAEISELVCSDHTAWLACTGPAGGPGQGQAGEADPPMVQMCMSAECSEIAKKRAAFERETFKCKKQDHSNTKPDKDDKNGCQSRRLQRKGPRLKRKH